MSDPTPPLPPLAVTDLQLNDYRGFRELEAKFGRFNVLVGVNGSGKTSILVALATCLSRITSRIVTGRTSGLQISDTDIYNASNVCQLSFAANWQDTSYGYRLTKIRRGRKGHNLTLGKSLNPDAVKFAQIAELVREDLSADDLASVPVVALYPVNRAVLDVPLRIRVRHKFDQVAAYDGAFQTQRNFRTFFEWFREREDLENEQRTEKPKFRDPQLTAVRTAIEKLMEGYSDLRVRRNPLRMTLIKNKEELLVNQLSDGEKALLSLVGDLARRLAIANPSLKSPLDGAGCVMVDEIELHLHPKWQRDVIQKLPEVFPNVQFFLTTHSPIVAGATPKGSLFVLADGQFKSAEAYGQDASLVLAEVFGVGPRLKEVRDKLDALFAEITFSPEKAHIKLLELEDLIGPYDPELVKARILLLGSLRG